MVYPCDKILSYLLVLFTRKEVHALFSHMISSVHMGPEAMRIFLAALLPAPLLSKSYISTFYHFMVVVHKRFTAWFPMYIHSYSGKLILSFCSNSIWDPFCNAHSALCLVASGDLRRRNVIIGKGIFLIGCGLDVNILFLSHFFFLILSL